MTRADLYYPMVAGDPAYASDFNHAHAAYLAIFGDGSDGALAVSSGTTNLSLSTVYQYTSINFSGGTISTTDSGNYGKPLIIKCQGDCTIAGTINLVGKGHAKGTGGAATAAGTNGAGFSLSSIIGVTGGAGAAGNATNDWGTGGCGGGSIINDGAQGVNKSSALVGVAGVKLALIFLGTTDYYSLCGAGGGGGGGTNGAGGGDGGSGGGAIILFVGGTLTFTGTINVSGEDGVAGTQSSTWSSGGGGGGGGGKILVFYNAVGTNSGTATVAGGAGGTVPIGSPKGTGGDGGDGDAVIVSVGEFL